jgi:nicotinic acetylcholine receptor alpha-7
VELIILVPVLGDENEYRLTRYLMANYDPSVRPAENSSEPLKVVFGISLHHIIDVVSLFLVYLTTRSQ